MSFHWQGAGWTWGSTSSTASSPSTITITLMIITMPRVLPFCWTTNVTLQWWIMANGHLYPYPDHQGLIMIMMRVVGHLKTALRKCGQTGAIGEVVSSIREKWGGRPTWQCCVICHQWWARVCTTYQISEEGLRSHWVVWGIEKVRMLSKSYHSSQFLTRTRFKISQQIPNNK